jgi:hypothetical protein
LTQRTGWRLGKQKSFTWARLFDEVTTPKLVKKTSSNNILLQRSSNPDYHFWIQLPADGSKFDAFPTDIKTWAETAVPRALKSAKEKDKTGKWVFDKPADWNKYVFVSSSSSRSRSLFLPCFQHLLTRCSFPGVNFICLTLGSMRTT